jgi:hypothetical protein
MMTNKTLTKFDSAFELLGTSWKSTPTLVREVLVFIGSELAFETRENHEAIETMFDQHYDAENVQKCLQRIKVLSRP